MNVLKNILLFNFKVYALFMKLKFFKEINSNKICTCTRVFGVQLDCMVYEYSPNKATLSLEQLERKKENLY